MSAMRCCKHEQHADSALMTTIVGAYLRKVAITVIRICQDASHPVFRLGLSQVYACASQKSHGPNVIRLPENCVCDNA